MPKVLAGGAFLLIVVVTLMTVVNVVDVHAQSSNFGPCDVAVQGQFAYVAASPGLRVVDISRPDRPIEVATYTIEASGNLALEGSFGYLLSGAGTSLHVLDLSDSVHPKQTGLLTNLGGGVDLAARGSYAYVATRSFAVPQQNGLRIVDVSDRTTPRPLGFYETSGQYTAGVVVSNGLAFLAVAEHRFDLDPVVRLAVLDVADPARPDLVGSYLGPAGISSAVALQDGFLYLGAGSHPRFPSAGGLYILDVSAPHRPLERGAYRTPTPVRSVAVQGSYVYVLTQDALHVLDVTEPERPSLIGLLTGIADGSNVAVAGRYAYVCSVQSGLGIIDISDPTRPSSVFPSLARVYLPTISRAASLSAAN